LLRDAVKYITASYVKQTSRQNVGIKPEHHLKAKIAAAKLAQTIGEWVEDAILQKIASDRLDAKELRKSAQQIVRP